MNTNSAKPRLAGLDGLRGISILLVIMGHSLWYKHLHLSNQASETLNKITTPLGLFGVPIFFVISGFLITYLLLREEDLSGSISLSLFWTRRFLRIVPPVALYVVLVVTYTQAIGLHLEALDLVSVIFFFRDLISGNAIFDHFWSLSIEEQFYLIWPLVIVLMPRRLRLPTCGLLLVAFPLIRLSSVCMFSHPMHVMLTRIIRFDSILAGCSLAIGWRVLEYRQFSTKTGDKLFLCGLASVLVAWVISYLAGVYPNFFGMESLLSQSLEELVTLFLNIGAVCIMIALATDSTRLGSFINMKWLTKIGVISYSLYLWQQFFFFAPGLPHWMYYLPVRLVGAFAVAACSYHFIERPMNRLRQRLWSDHYLAPPANEKTQPNSTFMGVPVKPINQK